MMHMYKVLTQNPTQRILRGFLYKLKVKILSKQNDCTLCSTSCFNKN